MEQVLCNSSGAIVARMPRPTVDANSVLIEVHYSMISVGTEIAPFRASLALAEQSILNVEKAKEYGQLAGLYLGAAIKDPRKAVQRIKQIGGKLVHEFFPRPATSAATIHKSLEDLNWEKCDAHSLDIDSGRLTLVTNDSEASYQVISETILVEQGMTPIVSLKGEVLGGEVSVGLLNGEKSAWLGSRNFDLGLFEDRLIFDTQGSEEIVIVIANCGLQKESKIRIDNLSIEMAPPLEDGLAHSELEDQGWNVGYSAAGQIISIGENIKNLAVGDFVACGGAGRANHAGYVVVPQNMVSMVPDGGDLRAAATTTIGTIALQGVRRCEPVLGEKICVIGLGLLGQLTTQMLKANGCEVLGFDLSADRTEKAMSMGLKYAASDLDEFKKLIRDVTGGHGVDRTIITAATKSSAVVNLSMEVTRPKGRVVIVGDVGLEIERPQFYKKELDLLMSTSYGPGRYDKNYEELGQDYPISYVRWTMNRNMEAYLSLLNNNQIDVLGLVDRYVPIESAPEIYKELAESSLPPLGVILTYTIPQSKQEYEAPEKITIQGHRKPLNNVANYALVGAGAFGISMLVPQMQKRKDLFFLRGVVSRSAIQASNFARSNQVEVLATDLDTVLKDDGFDLVVISTRHCNHANQVIESLGAGKNVFVEKPLALNWVDLGRIGEAYKSMTNPVSLMVGFNRRFSPAVQKLFSTLADRRSPLVINYRLNGGYIPPDSWVQDEQGGGRNIGEACHMYDVFRYLAGKPIESIAASSISPGKLPYLRNDNFCATLTYQDGSMGNLVYTALGPKIGLPKERVEVFCDGEAYLIDDYKTLTRCSDNEVLWSSNEVDKGHFKELSDFGEAIKNGVEAPISFDEIMETSAVALRVEDLIFGRGESDMNE